MARTGCLWSGAAESPSDIGFCGMLGRLAPAVYRTNIIPLGWPLAWAGMRQHGSPFGSLNSGQRRVEWNRSLIGRASEHAHDK